MADPKSIFPYYGAPLNTNAAVLEHFSNPDFHKTGVGLVITGPSRDERSTMANTVLRQFVEAGRGCLSLTPFQVVAAYHFGQSDRLRGDDVLLITDLGRLSLAEQDAIYLIRPVVSVTGILEHILDQRHANQVTTLITTEHELPELEAQFSPRLASLVGAVGFSIRLDGRDGELRADRC